MAASEQTGFPREEFARRIARVRERMADEELDGLVVSAPENVYYLTGLEHQGYFAYEVLVLGMAGDPILVTRKMEAATVRDQVPWAKHMGYSDGIDPLPAPTSVEQDVVLSTHDPESGEPAGLRPWDASLGVPVRGPIADSAEAPVRSTIDGLQEAGLERGRVGVEKHSSFLPVRVAERLFAGTPDVTWSDASGLVDDCRLVQSPLELAYTYKAAELSDSMMLAAIAASGPGVHERDVMAALYDAMFRRGGTYPGFIPLVRSTRTIQHEHGTWSDGRLRRGDLLFLEMAGCVRRYHAPLGRLVFIGRAPARAERFNRICEQAELAAAEKIGPGVEANDVYQVWQDSIDAAGLEGYRRHHCGYAVGIGFPPSWSGSGTPRGLRQGSTLELRPGMVFHLMSWLLRTGKGDSFLSDTIVVTETGSELLTRVSRAVTVR